MRALATDPVDKRPSSIAVWACAEYSTSFKFQLLMVVYGTFDSLPKIY